MTRRKLLKGSLLAGGVFGMPMILPAGARGQAGAGAPSERINLGVIGFGPRCRYDLGAILKEPNVRVIALCDVQQSRRAEGQKLVEEHYGSSGDFATCGDFRELLARKDIDAVLIATGDRWHARASILAMEAGKDVYSEKPCGLTIGLCQELAETAKRTGRVFQAGTQRRSVTNFQKAVQLATSGKLGKLKTLHASVYTPSIETTWLPGEPTPPKEVVDWGMWLGPAPWRPYNKQYANGRWRGYWDFDSGARLLDWGAHTLDLCQAANGADDTMPVEYEATDEKITARYANGVMLEMAFLATPFAERPGWITALGTCPVRFVGEAGWVETGDSGGIEVQPEGLKAELADLASQPVANGLDVGSHARNFFDCIKTRQAPAANAQVMMHSHIACHAAALSWILKRKLTLDPAKVEFINDDEANGLKHRPERVWAG